MLMSDMTFCDRKHTKEPQPFSLLPSAALLHVRFMGTCKMLIKSYLILVFGWMSGGMGGISPLSAFVSPFSYFVYIYFSVLM